MNIFNEHTWWYLARASGIVAVALLVMSVAWGIALATRVSASIRPAWTLEVHKWLSGLAFCATALHLVGLYLDGYINFGVADLFVPGASPYRPFAVALGILTLYAMVAVQVTSWARKRLSRRMWHAIHMLSYGVVWGGLLHAGLAGSDATNRAYQLAAAVMITVTAIAIGVRIAAPRRRSQRPSAAEPTPSTTPANKAAALSPMRPTWESPSVATQIVANQIVPAPIVQAPISPARARPVVTSGRTPVPSGQRRTAPLRRGRSSTRSPNRGIDPLLPDRR